MQSLLFSGHPNIRFRVVQVDYRARLRCTDHCFSTPICTVSSLFQQPHYWGWLIAVLEASKEKYNVRFCLNIFNLAASLRASLLVTACLHYSPPKVVSQGFYNPANYGGTPPPSPPPPPPASKPTNKHYHQKRRNHKKPFP